MCEYDTKADMWSFGCIFAQCFSRAVTFRGVCTVTQLMRIYDRLGTIPQDFIEAVPTDPIRNFIAQSCPERPREPVANYVPGASLEALDFLEQLLVYEPGARPSADEALRHLFFEKYYLEAAVQDAEPYIPFYEDQQLTLDEWKQVIFDEIASIQELRRTGEMGREPLDA